MLKCQIGESQFGVSINSKDLAMYYLKRIVFSAALIALGTVTTLSQVTETVAQKDDSVSEVTSNQPKPTKSELEKEFIAKYELGDKKGIRSKMLEEFELRTEPNCTSAKTGILVPKGEIVFIYKYFGEERCWAVEYDHSWGFVKDILIFPVSSNSFDSKVSKYDEPPQLKTQIKPKYPSEAKKKGIKGKVFIKVFIDENGEATEVIVLRGIDELNQAAIDAVKKAKYKPAKYQGEVVGVWVNLSINF
jgi:TonB family protein